ncbi:MAG TPA: AI-2E family transporter [Candidatus Hydrogenedentes bacterium]|nr:AI-2E family transporter [Candidatus Hydrogenedentota bacterium]HIB54579.1 AI-2E family transporter [Nitrospirales bacterium]
MTKGEYESRIQTVCLAILTVVTLAITLYLLRTVLVPFILAAFLTLILVPIVDFLVRKLKFVLPVAIVRPIALVLTMFMGFLVLLGVVVLIVISAKQFANNAGAYERQLTKIIDKVENSQPFIKLVSMVAGDKEVDPTKVVEPDNSAELSDSGSDLDARSEFGVRSDQGLAPESESTFELSSLLPEGAIKNIVMSLPSAIISLTSNILLVVLVMLFTAFLLTGSTTRTKPREGVIGEIETRVQKYIGIKIVLSMLTGFLVFLILKILGVDYALSFGAFAFILNFIPNVGSAIATLLPIPVVLLTPEVTLVTIVLAIVLPLTVQFVVGNVLEPKIMGDTLGLHPVVILMALIFWGMLWGFPGMLLAAPMTAIAKIVFERVEVTRPIAGLMEGRLETLDEM